VIHEIAAHHKGKGGNGGTTGSGTPPAPSGTPPQQPAK